MRTQFVRYITLEHLAVKSSTTRRERELSVPNRSTVLFVGFSTPTNLGDVVRNPTMSVRKRMDVDKLLDRPVNRKSRDMWRKHFAWYAKQLAKARQTVRTIVINAEVWKRWSHARPVLLKLLHEAFPDALVTHVEGNICRM